MYEDCFARDRENYRTCKVLSKMFCKTKGNCSFYKSKEQFNEDAKIIQEKMNNKDKSIYKNSKLYYR